MGTVQIDGSTPKITVGNATAEDATILFDGNAQDFYIALDDSADDLLIGLGSTVGTTPAISIDENLAVKTYGDITMTGTTPTLTIGDAGAEDTKIVFDGNAQDFYIALDDSADDLLIGKGSTVGTTPAIAIDENLKVNIPVTTASTSASTGSLTTGGGAGIGADLYVGDDAYLITDSAVLGFGADKDTTLTHTDGTGLTLNSTNKLCFNDASQFVQGSSATVLSIGATDEIDLTATAVDLNGTLDVSGATLMTTLGVITAKDLGVGVHIRVNDTGGSVSGDADALVIEDTAHSGMTLLTSTGTESRINFGDADANAQGAIGYDHNGEVMNFYSNQSAHTLSMTASNVVINEGSAAMNFRVETNGRTEGIYTTADNLSSGTTVDAGTLYATSDSSTGLSYEISGFLALVRNGVPLRLNNSSGDGDIMSFSSAGNVDGTISISGSTVSYNAFSGSHWSRLADNSKPTILRGTVMESIATMMDWYQVELKIPKKDSETNEQEIDEDDNLVFSTIKKSIALPVGKSVGDDHTVSHNGADYTGKILKEDNEQLPMCKISDTEDSKGVYGVFMNWDDADEGLDGDVNDMLVTALGAFIVRIHKDETVAIGDYLQSRGDGTAKVQADDILRASTIGKVTSTNKSHTHADDSYCVPCTLHCG